MYTVTQHHALLAGSHHLQLNACIFITCLLVLNKSLFKNLIDFHHKVDSHHNVFSMIMNSAVHCLSIRNGIEHTVTSTLQQVHTSGLAALPNPTLLYSGTGQEKSGVSPSNGPPSSQWRRSANVTQCQTASALRSREKSGCSTEAIRHDVTPTERHHWLEGVPSQRHTIFFLNLYRRTSSSCQTHGW